MALTYTCIFPQCNIAFLHNNQHNIITLEAYFMQLLVKLGNKSRIVIRIYLYLYYLVILHRTTQNCANFRTLLGTKLWCTQKHLQCKSTSATWVGKSLWVRGQNTVLCSGLAARMPGCKPSTKILPATFAWLLLLGCTACFFVFA